MLGANGFDGFLPFGFSKDPNNLFFTEPASFHVLLSFCSRTSLLPCSFFWSQVTSAYIFLSSAFPFSGAFNRLESVSLMRPYFLSHRWRVAIDICFYLQNSSWFKSLLSAVRNKRMISSGLFLFCFIVSRFVYSKLLTLFGPVFQAAAKGRLAGADENLSG